MTFDSKIIRDSFAKARPAAMELVTRFHATLVTDYPASKELATFANIEAQKRTIVRTFAFIVNSLENPNHLLPYLHDLGRRFAALGTNEEHYAWGTASLLKTLAEAFGRLWTPELESNWGGALAYLTDAMRNPVDSNHEQPAAPSEVPLHDADLLPPIVLPEELKRQIRASARQQVLKAVQQEMRLAIDEELRSFSLLNGRNHLKRLG